ncbi:MAG: hypothetical protein JWP00_4473 [Chloroflexi bacterium]|jgi:hypothetical protein|nr:hypothetical protein [Chloroflexota bacterium]
MGENQKPQSKPQDPVQPVKEAPEQELDEASLAEIAGGTTNHTFTSVSNILKTRHDTVKNSISNIR